MIRYSQVKNDAGLMRKYVVQHYGAALTYGGMSATYNQGMRMLKRLARMAGITREQALVDVRSDYELYDN